jgi:hypothetical protein
MCSHTEEIVHHRGPAHPDKDSGKRIPIRSSTCSSGCRAEWAAAASSSSLKGGCGCCAACVVALAGLLLLLLMGRSADDVRALLNIGCIGGE